MFLNDSIALIKLKSTLEVKPNYGVNQEVFVKKYSGAPYYNDINGFRMSSSTPLEDAFVKETIKRVIISELNYSETDRLDPVDAYGRSKKKGEVESPNMHYLRCSIIGQESHGKSLLGKFLNLPNKAFQNGYRNHIWNGVKSFLNIGIK